LQQDSQLLQASWRILNFYGNSKFSLSDDKWKEAARRCTLSRLKDISPDFVEEIIFIKEIYKIDFKIPLSPKDLFQEIV